MRLIKYIVLHCSAGPQNQSLDVIRNYWKMKGWTRPGYHHIIAADGTIHDMQPIELPSNGVAGFNAHSIHISYLGGVDAAGRPFDNRTDKQKAMQKMLVQKYMAMFPEAIVLGHRDFSPDKNRDGIIQPNEWMKSCPSFSVKDWLISEGISKAPTTISVKKMVITQSGRGVNIRKGPGLQFDVIAKLEDGQACIVNGVSEGWSFVAVNDKLEGWVSNNFLK